MDGNIALYNGVIYTLDEACPVVEALIIRDGRIAARGSSEEIRAVSKGMPSLDLAGRMAMPGFEDAHLHLLMHGLRLNQVDLSKAHSLPEALQILQEASQRPWQEGWLQGGGWDHNTWEPPIKPTCHDLDRLFPEQPVALESKDCHSLWVNSAALRAAGISRDTPDPAGGRIERDANGEPTGILSEKAGYLIRRVIPLPRLNVWRHAARAAMADCARHGITAVHNCEGGQALSVLIEMEKKGSLTLRVWQMIPLDSLDEAIALGLRTGFGNDRLRIGHVKMFADGALGSATAEMLHPYAVPAGSYGVAVTDSSTLLDAVQRAAAHGLASAIHAIGDAANRRVLDVYEALLQTLPGHLLRQRIEHVQLLTAEDLPRLAQLGVIASMQPIHATQDMLMAERAWGMRCRHAYAWRSLLERGTILAFGTDAPVESLDPLKNLYAAVTRQRPDGTPPGGWYPQERLTLREAIRAYTWGSAYAAYQEHLRGSLTPGKLGDVIGLSQDIFAQPPQALLETQVDLTILGGQIVFQR